MYKIYRQNLKYMSQANYSAELKRKIRLSFTGLHSVSHLGSERKAKEFQGWKKQRFLPLPSLSISCSRRGGSFCVSVVALDTGLMLASCDSGLQQTLQKSNLSSVARDMGSNPNSGPSQLCDFRQGSSRPPLWSVSVQRMGFRYALCRAWRP